ncbi:MAG: 3'(2'),5'-bisphosphate nucleotidase CysQ [Neomegalonema sp.]|nr:3'(2'),5'-bisphosphate nucleotidase CysQ [Neomegalonema sp.]
MRRIAIAAGDAIMPYFRGEASPDAEAKADGSPVTAADHAADKVIVDGLRALYPDAPIVTEEQAETQAHDPGDFFFLVDPLDGTKEFISGSGEFTVNIALIEQGAPRIGVVYAPAMGRLFWTPDPDFAVEERIDENGEATLERQLWVADANNAALRVVASKSHRDPATDAYISRYRTASAQSAGSSLKFCLLACGEADLYPRLGPTMAWDTAAAHAVLRAAGGAVCALSADGQVGAPLRYGPGAMLPKDEDAPAPAPTGRSAYANPFFVAYAPSVELR